VREQRVSLFLRTIKYTAPTIVRDVTCKKCEAKLGWMYEFATEDGQRYKEGRVILERAMVTEIDGIEELEPDDIPKKTD
jgi:hypothetical protein